LYEQQLRDANQQVRDTTTRYQTTAVDLEHHTDRLIRARQELAAGEAQRHELPAIERVLAADRAVRVQQVRLEEPTWAQQLPPRPDWHPEGAAVWDQTAGRVVQYRAAWPAPAGSPQPLGYFPGHGPEHAGRTRQWEAIGHAVEHLPQQLAASYRHPDAPQHLQDLQAITDHQAELARQRGLEQDLHQGPHRGISL
jgi:hypothetical protein